MAVEDGLSQGPELPRNSKVIPSESEMPPPVIDSRGEVVEESGPRHVRGARPGKFSGTNVRKGSSRPPNIPSWLWKLTPYKQRLKCAADHREQKALIASAKARGLTGEAGKRVDTPSADHPDSSSGAQPSLCPAAPAESQGRLAKIWKRATARAHHLGRTVDSVLDGMVKALSYKESPPREEDPELDSVPAMPTLVDAAIAEQCENSFERLAGYPDMDRALMHRDRIPEHEAAYCACVARPVNRDERRAIPKAQKAMDEEWARL